MVRTGDFSLQTVLKPRIEAPFLRPILFFMFLSVPLAVWQGSYNPIYIKEIFISIPLLLLWLAYSGNKRVEIRSESLFALIIPAWMFISFLFSPYKAQAMPVLFFAFTLSVLFIILSVQTTLADRKLSDMFLISAVPVLIIGISQIFLPSLSGGLTAFGDRIPSTLGNPNFFAAYIVVCVPFILAALNRTQGAKRIIIIIILLSALFLMYSTGSKAGIAALFAELSVWVLMTAVKKEAFRVTLKKNALTAAVAAAALVALFVMLPRNMESVKFRADVWSGTIRLAASNPITGTGPGSFSFAFPAFRPGDIMKRSYMHSYEVSYPENILLQAAAEYGIPGILMLIFFLWVILRRPDPDKKEFYSAFCGLLAINMAGVDMNYGTSAMLAAILAGVIINGRKGGNITLNGGLKRTVVISVAAVTALVIIFQFKTHISDVYLKQAVDLSELRQWQAAIVNYKKAIIHNPSNVPAGYFLASAYFDSNPEANAPAAVMQLEEVEKIAPNYVLLHYKKAGIFNYLGKREEAVAEYKKMLELDPYLKPALTELAYLYYREGDLTQAEMYMKRGAEISRDPALYNNLGNIYFMQKRVKEAVESYKKAIEINPDKDYYYNLGCVYFTLNDIKNAKENIYKAAELGSKSGKAEEKVENMVRQIERYERVMKR